MENVHKTAVAAVCIGGLYLWCMKPNRMTEERKQQMEPFETHWMAHRGLFDSSLSIPENSLPAFKRAVEHGYGIELDVRLTKDKKLVVFHDASLLRMCGVNQKVADLTLEELGQYSLENTSHHIPSLDEVLAVIKETVPVIIEIKADRKAALTAEVLNRKLCETGYENNYCVESFKPGALWWYRKNRPDILRGQLVSDYIKFRKSRSLIVSLLLNGLWLNVLTRPDFVAYNYHCAKKEKYRLLRKLYHAVCAGWTFHSENEAEQVKEFFNVYIFDGFLPEHDQVPSCRR